MGTENELTISAQNSDGAASDSDYDTDLDTEGTLSKTFFSEMVQTFG